ncbi:MAG: hypothetical protein JJT94_06900 [Bernardetiaceae bacterium]|nr:hypothetical protein [Bernardetiaceae bacterium]
MALQLLLSSWGVLFYTHTCNMREINQFSLFQEIEDCCSSAEPTSCAMASGDSDSVLRFLTFIDESAEDQSCCDTSTELYQLDSETYLLNGISLPYFMAEFVLFPSFYFSLFAYTEASISTQEILCFSDSSPPLYGMALRIRQQSFLL